MGWQEGISGHLLPMVWLRDLPCMMCPSPEPSHCSAPEVKGQKEGISLVKAGLNTALGTSSSGGTSVCTNIWHLMGHEMLRKPHLLQFCRTKGKLEIRHDAYHSSLGLHKHLKTIQKFLEEKETQICIEVFVERSFSALGFSSRKYEVSVPA